MFPTDRPRISRKHTIGLVVYCIGLARRLLDRLAAARVVRGDLRVGVGVQDDVCLRTRWNCICANVITAQTLVSSEGADVKVGRDPSQHENVADHLQDCRRRHVLVTIEICDVIVIDTIRRARRSIGRRTWG